MHRYSRQLASPLHLTKTSLAENDYRVLSIKMSRPIVVLRYLLSKLVFTGKEMSNVESVTLFEAFDQVVQKMSKDRVFAQKYGSEVFYFRAVFQELDFLITLRPQQRTKLLKRKYDDYRGNLFSKNYYKSVEGHALQLYKTYIKQRFPKKFPAKAYIGKGYGDHGTAKNNAFDASPHWKDVFNQFQAEGPWQSESYDPDYYRNFQVHPKQLLQNCLDEKE